MYNDVDVDDDDDDDEEVYEIGVLHTMNYKKSERIVCSNKFASKQIN